MQKSTRIRSLLAAFLLMSELAFSQNLNTIAFSQQAKIFQALPNLKIIYFQTNTKQKTTCRLITADNIFVTQPVQNYFNDALNIAFRKYFFSETNFTDSSDIKIRLKKQTIVFEANSANIDTLLRYFSQMYRILFVEENVRNDIAQKKYQAQAPKITTSSSFYNYLTTQNADIPNNSILFGDYLYQQEITNAPKYLIAVSDLEFDIFKIKIEKAFADFKEKNKNETQNKDFRNVKPVLYFFRNDQTKNADFIVTYFAEKQKGDNNKLIHLLSENFLSDINNIGINNSITSYNFKKHRLYADNRFQPQSFFEGSCENENLTNVLLTLTNADILLKKFSLDKNLFLKIQSQTLKDFSDSLTSTNFAEQLIIEKSENQLSENFNTLLKTQINSVSEEEFISASRNALNPEHCVVFAQGPKKVENDLFALSDNFEIRIITSDTSQNMVFRRYFGVGDILGKYEKNVCTPKSGKSFKIKIKGNYDFTESRLESFEIVRRKGEKYASEFYFVPDSLTRILVQKTAFDGHIFYSVNASDTTFSSIDDSLQTNDFASFLAESGNTSTIDSMWFEGFFDEQNPAVVCIVTQFKNGTERISTYEKETGFLIKIEEFRSENDRQNPSRTIAISDYRKLPNTNLYFPYQKKITTQEYSADFQLIDIELKPKLKSSDFKIRTSQNVR